MESLKISGRSRIAAATLVAATAAAGLAAVITLAPQRATALPAYAQQTGLPCGQCHANPAGGGALKAFGKKYQDNGHKVPGK
ncbi:MAG TPA: hypothetical protein VGH49_15710 [Xanthobacteraceae bacterium]